MSCFFFYFKPMGLYSGGLIHGLMFTLVTGVGLYEDGLIRGWAYTRVGLSVAAYGKWYFKKFKTTNCRTKKVNQ